MSRRKPRRSPTAPAPVPGPGRLPSNRPSLLDVEVEKKLIEASRQGMPVETAAAFAGIGKSTFMEWLARGRWEANRRQEGGEPYRSEDPYLRLLEQVDAAREIAHAGAVIQLRRLINGGFVLKEVTRKVRDPETGQIVEETTVDRAAPDFKAIAFYLERQHARHWGKDAHQTLELTGPQGGPLQVERVDTDELAERLAVTLHALEYPEDDDQDDDGSTRH